MLQEKTCSQGGTKHVRRWISDDYFDLIVWQEPTGEFYGFQLCYDKSGSEHALTWIVHRGFSHSIVDDGEGDPDANRTPVMMTGGVFPVEAVTREFAVRAYGIDPRVQDLVLTRLNEYSKSRES
jgi:hypothetical protein